MGLPGAPARLRGGLRRLAAEGERFELSVPRTEVITP
jgi:hypothetical protein